MLCQSNETLHQCSSGQQHDKIISYIALQMTDYSYFWDLKLYKRQVSKILKEII